MGQTQSTPKTEVDRTPQKEEAKNQPQPPALHQADADEDDENVKQLNECSSLYLALQVRPKLQHKIFVVSFQL